MKIRNKLYFLRRNIRSYFEYFKHRKKYQNRSSLRDNIILVYAGNYRIYDRYFYNFMKFLELSGVSVCFIGFNFTYFKNNVYKKQNSEYYKLIFSDRLFHFKKRPPKGSVVLRIKENFLSPDYFSSKILNLNPIENSFFIPMSMHPLMYKYGYWDTVIKSIGVRKHSIFMAGNFNENAYNQITHTPFETQSRVQVLSFLKSNNLILNIENNSELENFFLDSQDFSCIILDRDNVSIPMEKVRQVVSRFSFFLALPGIFMPYCHNLIEAISVGTIPIIHKEYANLMNPKFEHLTTAIVYNDLTDLIDKINFVYSMETDKIELLRKNVYSLYKHNFTPNSVFRKITENNYSLLYLQAQRYSLKILETNRSLLKN